MQVGYIIPLEKNNVERFVECCQLLNAERKLCTLALLEI